MLPLPLKYVLIHVKLVIYSLSIFKTVKFLNITHGNCPFNVFLFIVYHCVHTSVSFINLINCYYDAAVHVTDSYEKEHCLFLLLK